MTATAQRAGTARSGSLQVTVGGASRTGQREQNEDFFGWSAPEGPELDTRGVLLVVADGVGGAHGGREAAESVVRGLLADYYATPDTWEVARALDTVLGALNAWLIGQGSARADLAGMATTTSALVLRGSRYFVAHVGDTRIYRLDGEGIRQLTRDHTWDRPDMRHVLRRAVGLDPHLAVDYGDGEIAAGDIFVLCSDGVWDRLRPARIADIVLRDADMQRAADDLVDAAISSGATDNASALVVRVDRTAAGHWRDALRPDLPVPRRLRAGQQIDEYDVVDLLHESRATLLYRVRHRESGQLFALKTLQPALEHDRQSCEGLLAEEWLAKRIVSPHFAEVIPVAPTVRQFLYYVMTFHEGATLQRRLDRGDHFEVGELTRIGIDLAKGLGTLHRLSVLHRDIKPSNLIAGADGSLRILDLGVALAGGVPYPELTEGNPGTPSFMAPELWRGEPASVRTDLYAMGVTLYHLATRRYPYGEIEPFQTPRFGEPIPPTRHRPGLPEWFERCLLKAVARDPDERFETAEEFLIALERGDRQPWSPPRHTPLVHDAVTRWQAIAFALFIANLLLLYLLFVR